MIVHFDVDKNFAGFLKEKKYSFSLNNKNSSRVKNKQTIDLITVKSCSLVNKAVLQEFPNLKAIFTRTVGANHIDLDYCRKNKISVYHIPDYGAFAVAEHVFALLLSQTRKVISLNKETKKGKFSWKNGQGFTLKDKILGIIGVGKTGRETAKIAKGFSMKIIGFDKFQDQKFAKEVGMEYVDLDKLLKKADIISINIPLIKETYHLINEEQIKKMKNGVVLVNVSRGEIIDTQALVKNLDKFKYVCLDVLEEESIFNKKNPLISKLIKSDKVSITPHIAFFTDLTTAQICRITYKNIANYQKGIKINRLI